MFYTIACPPSNLAISGFSKKRDGFDVMITSGRHVTPPPHSLMSLAFDLSQLSAPGFHSSRPALRDLAKCFSGLGEDTFDDTWTRRNQHAMQYRLFEKEAIEKHDYVLTVKGSRKN